MCINFVCLASLHRECVYNTVLALHIDTSVLSDGTYELIPDSEGGDLEAQANTTVLTEAPDQNSEEPRAEIVVTTEKASPGHNLYFKLLSFTVIRF